MHRHGPACEGADGYAGRRQADVWGRKPLFLHGFAALPIRGVLYTLWSDPYYLISIQLLDSIGAGILGALFFIVIADLTQGTGHYNLAFRGFRGVGPRCRAKQLGRRSDRRLGQLQRRIPISRSYGVISVSAVLACSAGNRRAAHIERSRTRR